MRHLSFVILLAIVPILSSCASAPSGTLEANVRVFNIYRTGSEVPPKLLEGCEAKGSVSATGSEPEGTGVSFFDLRTLLPTIKIRAARNAADTVIVSFNPQVLEGQRRTLRGTAFRCGDHALPPELGEPLR